MKYILNGLEVDINETEFEFNEGAYVIDATYSLSGKSLTDSELEEFNDLYQAEIYQNAYENMAANAYDRAKDIMKYGE